MKTVELTEESFALIAALISPGQLVVHERVTASERAWKEIREAFPIKAFRNAVANGTLTYEPEL